REAEVLGDYPGARQMYQEAMAIFRDLGNSRAVAWAKNLLGFVGWAHGEYTEAFKLYEDGLDLYQKIGDVRGEAWTLDLMGNVRLAQREDQEAEMFYQRAYDLLKDEGADTQNNGWYQYHLGALLAFREKWAEGKNRFLKSLGYFVKGGDPLGQTAALVQLGEMDCALRNFSESKKYFKKALRTALESRLLPFLVDGLIGIAQLLKAEGDERQAISFLLVALNHPTCRRQTKDRIVRFSLELQSHFSSEDVEGAIQWAKASRIEDVVSAWAASQETTGPSKKKKTKKKAAKKKPKRKKRK